VSVNYQPITHPTQPEAAGGTDPAHAAAIARMFEDWNQALEKLHPLQQPDRSGPLRPYGTGFKQNERVPIPDFDVPPVGARLDAPRRRLGRPARSRKGETGEHPRPRPEHGPAVTSWDS
jgi:hypothetical protein